MGHTVGIIRNIDSEIIAKTWLVYWLKNTYISLLERHFIPSPSSPPCSFLSLYSSSPSFLPFFSLVLLLYSSSFFLFSSSSFIILFILLLVLFFLLLLLLVLSNLLLSPPTSSSSSSFFYRSLSLTCCTPSQKI